MDRRTLLVGLAGVAGCQTDRFSEPATGETPTAEAEPAVSPTRTTSPAPTTSQATESLPETLERNRPYVTAVQLVSRWNEPGDIRTERTDTVQRGQPAIVAFQYTVRLRAGTVPFKEGVDVLGPDGEVLARRVTEVDRTVPSDGVYTWETATTFDTMEWPTGSVTAAVTVGDLVLHRVSDTVTTTFSVVD